VNVFLWAAVGLVALELPLLAYVFFAPRLDALVGLQVAGTIFTLTLICLAQGFERTSYTILAVVASVLTFAGGLAFVRFLDRELEP
jgi:multisubunit Na+/H+ antiporter MnhF subunit